VCNVRAGNCQQNCFRWLCHALCLVSNACYNLRIRTLMDLLSHPMKDLLSHPMKQCYSLLHFRLHSSQTRSPLCFVCATAKETFDAIPFLDMDTEANILFPSQKLQSPRNRVSLHPAASFELCDTTTALSAYRSSHFHAGVLARAQRASSKNLFFIFVWVVCPGEGGCVCFLTL
jgi:hypothetical protein